MLRRWVRSLVVTVLVAFVVTSAVGAAAAPLVEFLPDASISADLGDVRIVIGI